MRSLFQSTKYLSLLVAITMFASGCASTRANPLSSASRSTESMPQSTAEFAETGQSNIMPAAYRKAATEAAPANTKTTGYSSWIPRGKSRSGSC